MKDNLTYKAKKLFHSLLNKVMARTYLKQTTCNEYMQTVYKAMSLQTLKQENIFDLFLKNFFKSKKKTNLFFLYGWSEKYFQADIQNFSNE